MTALAITITPEGIAAAVNAANTGTGPLVITQIALLSAPTTEIKRISTIGGDSVADNIIHVTITDETTDTYSLTGLRLITDGGIIFGTYHQASPLLEKAADTLALISADILLTSVPAGSVTIGGTGFQYPPATTTRQGVIEIATDAEVQTGTDTTRALTPAGLQSAASATDPSMNGPSAIGTAKRWARADHVHPSDTAKANTSGTYPNITAGNASNLGSQLPGYYTNIPARLGYTPVQQGTGVGQTANAIKIGWSAAAKLKATVDNGDLGNIAFEPWVLAQIAALINGSPAALDTLNELSAALGNDPNFATTILNALAGKAAKTGDTFSGPVVVSSASEAQVHVAIAGQNTAYLFSNPGGWGLYSASGGSIIGYTRADGKVRVGGVDTSLIVENNGGTYGINITGNSGNADTVDGYHASQLWRADMAASWPGGFKLPNGWIMQFGSVFVDTDSSAGFLFPVAFPNECIGVFGNGTSSSIASGATQAGLTFYNYALNGATALNDGIGQTFKYLAIGK